MKEQCNCGQVATWVYGPGYRNGDSPFFCDDCVPRECQCNHRYVDVNAYDPPLDQPEMPWGVENKDWKWIEIDKVWEYIDDNGKPYPCVEFEYDSNGFELD